MASSEPLPPSANTPQPHGHAGRRTRRPHRSNVSGGRGRGRGRGGTMGTPRDVATLGTIPDEPPDLNSSAHERGHIDHGGTRGRGYRHMRGAPHRAGRGRGGYESHRPFGGHLSRPESNTPSALAADAPVFVPGKPVVTRNVPIPVRPRRLSKSQAPDLATRMHEDITNGQYECVICTNEVLANSRIWSCETCWAALHLSCVKRWAQNASSTQQQQQEGQEDELPPPRQWRCPACNTAKDQLPGLHHCWCGKEAEPRSLPGKPHSCGQTCGKPRRGKCPHPCMEVCHAGPCPPCTALGPSMTCYCGAATTQRRCIDTDYDQGWSCGQVCGELLPCTEHECRRKCHEGLCGSCDVPIDCRCFCGNESSALACSDRLDSQESSTFDASGRVENWTGCFDCGAECLKPYDCGVEDHCCRKTCHAQDTAVLHCPLSTDVVKTCPCGKTDLIKISSKPRTKCTDPIPSCEEFCDRTLHCGHTCQMKCHVGECRPCMERISLPCRCGKISITTLCQAGREESPQCFRICRARLNCGRHECGEHCCAGERKAAERQMTKKKSRSTTTSTAEIEAEHVCLRTCNRPLKCGNSAHLCQELCHKGPCRSCLEAVFEDISCHCGRTVLVPPNPCGTVPPACTYDCDRRRPCGHPQTSHPCHGDDQSCPKCPYLVEKICICGKRTLKSQPCWATEVRCGLICGKLLRCGVHTCDQTCHRDCKDQTCGNPCGKKKTVCEHHCSDPCHSPFPCDEKTPCQAKMFITCACQHQKQAARCLASKTSDGNTKKVLECNDECLRLQRNAKLAAALNIDPATHVDDHIPYSAATLDFYKANTKAAQQLEREVRVFANEADEKRLRFKPLPSSHRAFLHSLAEDFGFDSESQDPEPHRHVCFFKTPRFVSAPMKTLGQCVKIKAIAADAPVAVTSKPAPFNALLLCEPRFGITAEEVQAEIASEVSDHTSEIVFLADENIVVRIGPQDWEADTSNLLQDLKPRLLQKIRNSKLASTIVLCAVDQSGSVLRREADSISGWSQVARGAARARAPAQSTVGTKSSFTVLGSRLALKKTVRASPEAVDDWEKEVDGWT